MELVTIILLVVSIFVSMINIIISTSMHTDLAEGINAVLETINDLRNEQREKR